MSAFIPAATETANRIRAASQYLQNRNPDAALAALQPLLPWKPSAQVLFLAGLAHRVRGELAEAEEMFRRSLRVNSRQIATQVQLAQVLHLQNRAQEAIRVFRQVLRLDEADQDAHMGLAAVLHDRGDHAGAERVYRNLLKRQPDCMVASQALGSLLAELDRADEADTVFRSALALTNDKNARATLEQALGAVAAQQNRLEQALVHFGNTGQLVPRFPQIDLNRAAILQRLNRHEEAADVLRAVVRREPENIEAHNRLNHILYGLGEKNEFLSSYDDAQARLPGGIEIPLAKARFLLTAERFGEAKEIFSAVLKVHQDSKAALAGLLIALPELGELEEASEIGKLAMEKYPSDAEIYANTASLWLRMRKPARAQEIITRALELDIQSQVSLALQGLIWRAIGCEDPITDYENQIRVFDLSPPAGWDGMAAFNSALTGELDSLHSNAQQYIDQSLRSGTQTVGNIFGAGHRRVEQLKTQIMLAVGQYIAEMPEMPSHPFYRRRTGDFRFTGSWSSRLRDHGFHISHIHSQGWISSCYYVSLPDAVNDTERRQGWIEFGRPTHDIGLSDPVLRAIQPRAGQLILFPSYMLHGTVPFRSARSRTTVAFDVIPA